MSTISLYAILRADNTYYGGFDRTKDEAIIVDNPIDAKLFSNKFDVNLRPDERLVELTVTMTKDNTQISTPFRPRKRELVTLRTRR